MSRDDFTETLDLVRRAKHGDRAGMDALLARYGPTLLSRIRLMMGPGARRVAESGDFLQIVFGEIVDHIETFEPRDERAFGRWATQIARNRIRDEVRRKRERALDSFATRDGRGLPEAADGETPSREVVRRELVERMVDALAELPPDDQRVIELHHLEGVPLNEVAQLLERSANAVYLLHGRALARLGRAMGESPDL